MPLMVQTTVGSPKQPANDTVSGMQRIMHLLGVRGAGSLLAWWIDWNTEPFDSGYPVFTPR